MAHADAYIYAIRDELRSLGYSVSQCLLIDDDPQGDFGIAWYLGIDRSTGCARMRYDVGYLPSKHTVVHEFGHDIHAKWEAAGIFQGFWSAAGFPLTPDEAINAARASGSQYGYWQRTPSEMLAEVFAWTVLGDYCQTEMFGVALTPDLRTKLQAYFKTYGEEEDVALTDADRAQIQASIEASENRIKQVLQTQTVDILREVLGKLDAGFNTTLATLIDRQTAGDKKVSTAEVD